MVWSVLTFKPSGLSHISLVMNDMPKKASDSTSFVGFFLIKNHFPGATKLSIRTLLQHDFNFTVAVRIIPISPLPQKSWNGKFCLWKYVFVG